MRISDWSSDVCSSDLAILALVINIGAYTCEIVRAGIESIHKGQLEAAECLGLTPTQIYLHIILRPAIERVCPALASQYVLLMLVTSILSAVGANELFGVRPEEHTAELQSLMRISYAVLCYKKKNRRAHQHK